MPIELSLRYRQLQRRLNDARMAERELEELQGSCAHPAGLVRRRDTFLSRGVEQCCACGKSFLFGAP